MVEIGSPEKPEKEHSQDVMQIFTRRILRPVITEEDIYKQERPASDVVKEEIVASPYSSAKKSVGNERPPLYLLSLQVAQTVKSKLALRVDFRAFEKLSELQERGAMKEEIQIQKMRVAWECEMTGLLLREKW